MGVPSIHCSLILVIHRYILQECRMSFNLWGYVGSEVYLHPTKEEVQMSYYTENGEWTLASTKVERVDGGAYTSDTLTFIFVLKRKPSFLIVNVVLPIVFMAIINILVFLLPAESGERVSYSVTVLLALAVFMTLVGDNLPKTSEPMPILSYYLMILLIMSTLMTVTTILNLKIYFKKGPVSPCIKFLFRILCCFRCRFGRKTDDNKVYPIDLKNKDKIPVVNISKPDTEEPEITWQEISSCIDLIAILFFLFGTIIINAIFLSILAKNKDSAFNKE